MKTAGKIFKIALLLFTVLILSLTFAAVLLQDKVGDLILATLNNKITSKVDAESVRLSLIRNFPKASIELNNIYLLSAGNINKKDFNGTDTDTLLRAGSMYVSFSISDIIRKKYDIDRISVSDGKITLLADSSGKVNYMILKDSGSDDLNDTVSNPVFLERIRLNNLDFSYIDKATKLVLEGRFKSARLSGRISDDKITMAAEGEMLLSGFEIDRIKNTLPLNASLNLKMDHSAQGIIINRGSLTIEGIRFIASGRVTNDKHLDLDLTADNVDLVKIRKYLPAKYQGKLHDYNFEGLMNISGKLTGNFSAKSNPHFELNCSLLNGKVANAVTGLNISMLNFNCSYSNGSLNNQETAMLSVRNLTARLGSADLSGNIRIKNLYKPLTQLELKARIIPYELKQYFGIDQITKSSGSADMDLKLETSLRPGDSLNADNLLKVKTGAAIIFNDLSIGLAKPAFEISHINGRLNISEDIEAKKLVFVFRDQKVTADGIVSNLPEWLTGRKVLMKANGSIHFNKLIPANFRSSSEKGQKKIENKAVKEPENISLNLVINIDSLKYPDFLSEKISARLVYNTGLLSFNSLHLNTLGGAISGNGFIARNKDKSYVSKGIFNVSDIDINRTFSTFRNFGQDFIRAENLSGSLTGNLTLLMPSDSLMKPIMQSLVAEGNYVIKNGSLMNFEPVRELSSFIELSELENIHFDKLENDFFIRNNYFYLPQMEVSSSAADLSVNGKHSFGNSFEYHVKIRLSELLSKKRKKADKSVTEFGVVEDDGLGRTSLLLKIMSTGGDIKVAYDVKAAGEKVKSGIKSEKKNLKKILNEEYGFFSRDTITEQKPAEKKTRFRISWDESEIQTENKTADTAKKDNTIRSLFRKK